MSYGPKSEECQAEGHQALSHKTGTRTSGGGSAFSLRNLQDLYTSILLRNVTRAALFIEVLTICQVFCAYSRSLKDVPQRGVQSVHGRSQPTRQQFLHPVQFPSWSRCGFLSLTKALTAQG